MTKAYDFAKAAFGLSSSDIWLMVGAFKGDAFTNPLRTDSYVVVFPDSSSLLIHDANSDHPRVVARSRWGAQRGLIPRVRQP